MDKFHQLTINKRKKSLNSAFSVAHDYKVHRVKTALLRRKKKQGNRIWYICQISFRNDVNGLPMG